MNHPDPTLDELVSAYLDGEATDEEITRIQASPELSARVEILRRVQSAVGARVDAPPPGHRDAAVAAALAESNTSPNIAGLRARSKRPDHAVRWASAAAVVAAAMLTGSLVLLNRDTTDDHTVASADTAVTSDHVAADESDAITSSDAEEPAVLDEAADVGADGAEPESASAAPRRWGALFLVDPPTDTDELAESLLVAIADSGPITDHSPPHPCTVTIADDTDGTVIGYTESQLAGEALGALAYRPLDQSDPETVVVYRLEEPDCPVIDLVVGR